MEVIHISEAEAVRDFAGLLARARAGAEVIIESAAAPAVVLRGPVLTRRSLSESIARAEARTRELGYKAVMDEGFAADMEEIIRNRRVVGTAELLPAGPRSFSLHRDGERA